MSASLNTTALAGALYNYCRDNKGPIVGAIYYSLFGNKYLPNSLSNWCVPAEIGATEIPLTARTTKSMLQRANRYAFEPTPDAINFEPRILKTTPAKADLLIYPQELEASFLAIYRKKKGSITNDEVILLEYILADIFSQLQDDARTCIVKGDKIGSPVANTLLHSFDGFEKLWTSLGSSLTTITATGSTYTEKIESIWDQLDPTLQQSDKSQVVVAADVWKKLIRENKSSLGRKFDYTNVTGTEMMIDGFLAPICMEPKFINGRVLAQKKGNCYVGMDNEDDLKQLEFIPDVRSIKVAADFKFGVQVVEARGVSTGTAPMVISSI